MASCSAPCQTSSSASTDPSPNPNTNSNPEEGTASFWEFSSSFTTHTAYNPKQPQTSKRTSSTPSTLTGNGTNESLLIWYFCVNKGRLSCFLHNVQVLQVYFRHEKSLPTLLVNAIGQFLHVRQHGFQYLLFQWPYL